MFIVTANAEKPREKEKERRDFLVITEDEKCQSIRLDERKEKNFGLTNKGMES